MARISAEILRKLILSNPPLIVCNSSTSPHPLPLDVDNEINSEFIDQLTYIEGSSFDLRIDSVSIREASNQPTFIGRETRRGPFWRKILPAMTTPEGPAWCLRPGTYLIDTMEIIHMPEGIVEEVGAPIHGELDQRVTLFEHDATVSFGFFPAGFHGRVKCHLHVHNDDGIKIVRGARVITIGFNTYAGTQVDPYQGQRISEEGMDVAQVNAAH